MRKAISSSAILAFLWLGLAGSALPQAPAAPQERGARAPEAKPDEKCDAAATKEESSATDHSIRVGGQTISYKATASTTLLKNDKGASFPAFVAGMETVHALGRLGVSEVWSFLTCMPPLIITWFYFIGWLLDRWKSRRTQRT